MRLWTEKPIGKYNFRIHENGKFYQVLFKRISRYLKQSHSFIQDRNSETSHSLGPAYTDELRDGDVWSSRPCKHKRERRKESDGVVLKSVKWGGHCHDQEV